MTNKNEYFSNQNISEEERRNNAFQAVNAMRESLTLAKNSTTPVTYEFAFGIIYDLDPSLYDSIISLLTSKNESDLVKYYKEMAEAESSEENVICPTTLIQDDLDKLDIVLKKKPDNNTNLKKKEVLFNCCIRILYTS